MYIYRYVHVWYICTQRWLLYDIISSEEHYQGTTPAAAGTGPVSDTSAAAPGSRTRRRKRIRRLVSKLYTNDDGELGMHVFVCVSFPPVYFFNFFPVASELQFFAACTSHIPSLLPLPLQWQRSTMKMCLLMLAAKRTQTRQQLQQYPLLQPRAGKEEGLQILCKSHRPLNSLRWWVSSENETYCGLYNNGNACVQGQDCCNSHTQCTHSWTAARTQAVAHTHTHAHRSHYSPNKVLLIKWAWFPVSGYFTKQWRQAVWVTGGDSSWAAAGGCQGEHTWWTDQ